MRNKAGGIRVRNLFEESANHVQSLGGTGNGLMRNTEGPGRGGYHKSVEMPVYTVV